MKIISIVGSPRGTKGNTARLLNEVIKGAENMGAQNETIFLCGDSVLSCLGCDKCHVKGKCIQKDKFEITWKHKKRYKTVEKQMSEFRQRMQYLMEYRKKEWPYEYSYWKKYRSMP